MDRNDEINETSPIVRDTDEVTELNTESLPAMPEKPLASAPPPVPPATAAEHVHGFGESTDESLRGGFASVKGTAVAGDNRLVWIVLIVMSVMCLVVGVCSALITAHFMRTGATPPVISSGGDVRQDVESVVSARKSCIAEVNCGGLNGSGVVTKRVGESVYVITNAHVLEHALSPNIAVKRKIAVRFYGEDDYFEARVLGYDLYYDVAVLTVEHKTLFTVYDLDGSKLFGPDVEYKEGDRVVSIGNAMGMGVAAYDGIISRSNELLECDALFIGDEQKIVPVLRTTAVINAGMSGGGLFDIHGNLLGIGTYRLSNTDGVDKTGDTESDVEDTGFVTPISILYPVYKRILAASDGEQVGLMDISLDKSDKSAIGRISFPFGFTCEYRNGKLTVVGTPTDTRVAVGDVIAAIGKTDLTDGKISGDICRAVGLLLRYHPRGNGDALTITFKRGSNTSTLVYDRYLYAA